MDIYHAGSNTGAIEICHAWHINSATCDSRMRLCFFISSAFHLRNLRCAIAVACWLIEELISYAVCVESCIVNVCF